MNNPEFIISIAGISTSLDLSALPKEKAQELINRYSGFAVNEDIGGMKILVDVVSGEPFVPLDPGPWVIETWVDGEGAVHFKSYFEAGWFNLQRNCGELIMRRQGNPENFLRVMYAWRLLDVGGLLVHASGMIKNGFGYSFFGASGSGKTTTTELSSETQILSDDLVALTCNAAGDDGIITLHGVPFRGMMVERPQIDVSAPLRALFSLNKSANNALSAMSRGEAIARLSSCVPFVMSDAQNSKRVLSICGEIVSRIPVMRLNFRKDPSFWTVIDDYFSTEAAQPNSRMP